MACFKDRKKQQRRINKVIKYVNKKMKEDTLWRGRFQVKQVDMKYIPDAFGGEGLLYPYIQLIDKKTGRTNTYWMTYLLSDTFDLAIFVKLNTFITEYCKVWSEKPSPREQTETYY